MDKGKEYQEFIPSYLDVPEKERLRTLEIAQHYEDLTQKAFTNRVRKIERYADKTTAKLLQSMGAENYEALRRFVRDQRTDLRIILEPPDGPNISEKELHDIKIEKATKFLQERKISVDSVRKIICSFSEYFEKVLSEEEKNVSETVPESDVPKGIILYKTNPWSIYRPPFNCWQRGFEWASMGYRVRLNWGVDERRGTVNNQIRMDNFNAGDVDGVWARLDTQICFWYRTDRAGLIEVWIEAENVEAEHHLELEDEWGWSDSDTRQTNYLMMHVIHPNIGGPSLARMSWFHAWGNPDHRIYRREFLGNGRIYRAHLFSDARIPANTWVRIRCGTRSWDRGGTNDVEVHSRTVFSWSIRSVQVRTSG